MKITAKQAKEILYNETREFEIIEHKITHGREGRITSVIFSCRGRYFQFTDKQNGPFNVWELVNNFASEIFECPEVRMIIEYTETYKFEKIK